MSSKVTISARTNPDVKMQAQQLFSSLGMDISTAINLFLVQSIQCHGLPFDVTLRKPNSETLQAIIDTNLNGPFHSVSDLMRSLDA